MGFTETAARKVMQLITEEANPELKLRVYISGGGCSGFQYGFTFDEIQAPDDFAIDKDGVTLLVDPRIVLTDDQAPAATFLQAIEAMGMRAGITHALWQQAGTLRVRREAPHWTPRGKLMPLHLDRWRQ